MTGGRDPVRQRLAGLDLARYLALVGMVIVNFDVVMVGPVPAGAGGFAEWLQGRAAATFVVLAGVGFGLGARDKEWSVTSRVTLKRVGFLFALGMINMAIFPADIIHYYAFYFLLCLPFLGLGNRHLLVAILAVTISFPLLSLVLDYDTGWQWETVSYEGLWTVDGYLRNLVFNGWHPVIPWIAFFLGGVLLSRARLHDRKVQCRLLVAGTAGFTGALLVSALLSAWSATIDPELHYLFSAAPIPPMPLFVIAGSAIACAVIGLCLLLAPWLNSIGILELLTPAGRQTLTLYIAHIVIGMGILEGVGMIGGQTARQALIAALLFCVVATVFSFAWLRAFKRGPLEGLMRRVTG